MLPHAMRHPGIPASWRAALRAVCAPLVLCLVFLPAGRLLAQSGLSDEHLHPDLIDHELVFHRKLPAQ